MQFLLNLIMTFLTPICSENSLSLTLIFVEAFAKYFRMNLERIQNVLHTLYTAKLSELHWPPKLSMITLFSLPKITETA